MYDLSYNEDVGVTFVKTAEYVRWYELQSGKTRYIIEARLRRIAENNHWGLVNYFDGLIELKWSFGMRVYTVRVDQTVILLLGGNKNDQDRDIKKAKSLLGQ